MKNLEILKRNKRIEIEKLLKKNYDIKIPFKYHLIKLGKEKIRIFSGNLKRQDLLRLNKILTINYIGLYFAFFKSQNQEFRLGFDSAILFGKNSNKFVELSNSEAEEWLKGRDIEKETEFKGYILIKYGTDILGCGKATGKKILNFVPKERRIYD